MAQQRILRVGASVVLGAIVTALMLVLLDRSMDWFDLGYRARRNAPSSDVRLKRSEFEFQVVTNALGFRDPRLPTPKPTGTVRLVVAGDSFTQGFGVAEDEAYPRRLETLLRLADPSCPYEVVNLGVPGTNPRDYEGNVRDVGLSYEPDVVVVAVGANDVHDGGIQPRSGTQFGWERLTQARQDAQRSRSSLSRLPRFLWPTLYPFVREELSSLLDRDHAQTVAQSDAPRPATGPPSPVARWQDVLLALAEAYGCRAEAAERLSVLDAERVKRIEPLLTGALRLDTEEGEEAYWNVIAVVDPNLMRDAVLLPPAYDDAWRRVADRLRGIGRRARGVGARTVLTFIPDQYQVSPQGRGILEEWGFHWDERTLVDTTFNERLRALAAEERMDFVDLLTSFREQSSEALYFPRDGHWTPAGHELAARVLAAGLGHRGPNAN